MIRVTIDLVPNGNEEHKATLDTIEIVNVNMHPDDFADYLIYRKEEDRPRATIRMWDRKQGVHALVTEAMRRYQP